MPVVPVALPPPVVVPPRCAEVVAPYIQALNVNSHAIMNIFEALCASMDVLETRVMEANAQMSSRVSDLESSFKNFAHNVQGFSEPIRHPATPSGKRRPHSRAMVSGDENCDRAIERMHEIQQEADFLDLAKSPLSSPYGAGKPSYFPVSPAGGGGKAETFNMQPALASTTKRGSVPLVPPVSPAPSEGKKKRLGMHLRDRDLVKREMFKTAAGKWRWAVHEVRQKNHADRMSLMHSRAPSKLSLRDRLVHNETHIETLQFQVDRFYETFVELVVKDKKQQQIDALRQDMDGLLDKQAQATAKLALHDTILKEQEAALARAVEESRALMAKQEEELAAFKKYTTDNLEMQHEKGEKLRETFHSLATMSLHSLLVEVEARLLDAAAFEEEDLSVALTTLRDNLKHAIAIATDHKAIKSGLVKEMADCLLKNINDVMDKARHAKIRIDPALLQRLDEAELQLSDLARAQQQTDGQVSRIAHLMTEMTDKMEAMTNDNNNIKMDLASKVGMMKHDEDLERKANVGDLDSLRSMHKELAIKVYDQQDTVLTKLGEVLEAKVAAMQGPVGALVAVAGQAQAGALVNGQPAPAPADPQAIEQVANLAREVNRALADYDLLRQEVGSKAASDEVTSALQAMDAKMMQLQLDALNRDDLEDWLGTKADRQELNELANRLATTSGAEYEGSLSFIIARKRVQPVLRCLSCDHPLPLKKVKHIEEDERRAAAALSAQQQQHDWQMMPLPHVNVKKRTTQDDMALGQHYTLDPLMLQDGPMLSRYPRMMPPPNRVRTAVGGGGLGLSVRSRLKEKLEYKKREESELRMSPSRNNNQKQQVAPSNAPTL